MINEFGHDKLHLLLDEEVILSRIKEMAKEITNNLSLSTDRIVIIGIMDGCLSFLYNLIKDIPLKLEVKTIKIKTYQGKTQNDMCKIDIVDDDLANIKGARVIIVDDILDSGKTLLKAFAETAGHLPSSIKSAVLLDKGKSDIQADYVGFNIPDKWVFGFGMDLDGFYRNVKDIYIYQ